MKYFKSIKSELEDSEQEWEDLLKSNYWKFPPNWTRASDENITFWSKIKNLLYRIYDFLVKRITYEEYFASQLRSRYLDIEGNFRTTERDPPSNDPNFKGSSDFIKELLILSKGILEQKNFSKKDLLTASSLLDEAEERMIWILPQDVKSAKVKELNYHLDNMDQGRKDECKKTIDCCRSNQQGSSNENENQHNAELEEIIRVINKDTLSKRINTGLQIERLRALRFWGLILLIIFIFLFPITSNVEHWTPAKNLIWFWDNQSNSIADSTIDLTISTNASNISTNASDISTNASDISTNGSNISTINPNSTREQPKSLWNSRFLVWFIELVGPVPTRTIAGWALALGFSIIGAIGGFLSGLLQVRTSTTNLELYEEAVLLFQIRPIFGALAALIVYVLIAWSALDMVHDNDGNIVLAAFLSGFSERYFLKLMPLEPEPKEPKGP
jgi:hypothetical protein